MENKFLTLEQTAKARPAFTVAALRDMKFKAFNRQTNSGMMVDGNGSGDFGVWIQLGNRVLVDIERFDKWIESKRLKRGA